MKKSFGGQLLAGFAAVFLGAGIAFAAEPHVVTGKIAKIVPKQTEIYVKSDADGEKYEYYFTKETVVTWKGESKDFSALKKDQSVKVTANKVGKRLDPVSVEIME